MGETRFTPGECAECGRRFKPRRSTSRYCSRPCSWANNGGYNRKPETWWVNSRGYIEGRVTLPDGSQRRVKQHRWVMEQKLGRVLFPSEDVHHLDGNKQNNDEANLALLTHGEHSQETNRTRTYRRGYTLDLPAEERARRSAWMSSVHARRREAKETQP